MARKTRTAAGPRSDPGTNWWEGLSLDQREAMIREAAYYRYEKHGRTPGHDLDDWFAAEAELDRIMPEPYAPGSAEFLPDIEVQQSSVHGAMKDDELKRIIKQHPQKGIPQIESIEPKNAPFKE